MPARCEVCASLRVARWGTVAGYVHYRCVACRHLYVYPRPSPEVIEAYYCDARFYDKAQAEETRLVAEARARVRSLWLLADACGLERRLLDVGCASGIFLEEARNAGWAVEGVELSPALSARARAKGLGVVSGWLEDLPGDATYPVVTAWEVIEHAIDPVGFFRRLRARVRPGGLLAVSTPQSDGLPATVLGARFPMICPPEHLSLFSRKSLRALGAREGFEVATFRSFSNLKRDNLTRGLSRLLFGAIPEPRSVAFRVASAVASILTPVPAVVDALGIGSEMEVVFRLSDSGLRPAVRG